MNKLISLPIALLALAAVQAPARAGENEPRTRIVTYNDLDLTRPSDVDTLQHRISKAIIAVCDYSAPTGLPMLRISARCRKETAQRMQIQVAMVVRGQRGIAARDADGGRRVRVSIADLDLGRQQDRRTLKQRLGLAVVQACGARTPAEQPVSACRAELKSQLPAMVTRVA